MHTELFVHTKASYIVRHPELRNLEGKPWRKLRRHWAMIQLDRASFKHLKVIFCKTITLETFFYNIIELQNRKLRETIYIIVHTELFVHTTASYIVWYPGLRNPEGNPNGSSDRRHWATIQLDGASFKHLKVILCKAITLETFLYSIIALQNRKLREAVLI